MDTNYNNDFGIFESVNNFVIIDENTYRLILANINCNYLMILFTMSCVCALVCSYKKPRNDYLLVQDSKPVNGTIVEEAINKV